MSTPIIIIPPNGDAMRADTITAVRADVGYLYVRCEGDVYLGGSFATCELAKAARDSVIEQWQAALASASVPAPTPADPGYALACALVDEVLGGGS